MINKYRAELVVVIYSVIIVIAVDCGYAIYIYYIFEALEQSNEK